MSRSSVGSAGRGGSLRKREYERSLSLDGRIMVSGRAQNDATAKRVRDREGRGVVVNPAELFQFRYPPMSESELKRRGQGDEAFK